MKRIKNQTLVFFALALLALSNTVSANAQGGRPPDREFAYFDGETIRVSAIDWLPSRAPQKVQGDIFVVVYPIGWESFGLAAPQCSSCDHAENGPTFDDFHDHVLDSVPTYRGFTPLKRVNVILPNYSFLAGIDDPARDAAVSAAYASRLPATSVSAVEDLLARTAPDGSPLAIRVDARFYIRVSTSRGDR